MKTAKYFGLITAGLLLVSVAVRAQDASDKEHQEKMKTHHKVAKDHASAIANGQSKTKAEHQKHADEADKNLAEAKKHNEALQAKGGKHKASHDAIAKHHADAGKHSKAMKDEAAKPSPDDKKLKDHAKNFNDSMDKAEQEREKTKDN